MKDCQYSEEQGATDYQLPSRKRQEMLKHVQTIYDVYADNGKIQNPIQVEGKGL